MGKLSWIIQVALMYKDPYKRETGGSERRCDDGSWEWGDARPEPECRQPQKLEKAREQIPPRSSRRNTALRTP